MCDCLRLCDETCCELELERICYDEMERESMAYFYESQREIQRYLKRIRQLEMSIPQLGSHAIRCREPADPNKRASRIKSTIRR